MSIMGNIEVEFDMSEKRLSGGKNWQTWLKACSLCTGWFKTEFEQHNICPLCVREIRCELRK